MGYGTDYRGRRVDWDGLKDPPIDRKKVKAWKDYKAGKEPAEADQSSDPVHGDLLGHIRRHVSRFGNG